MIVRNSRQYENLNQVIDLIEFQIKSSVGFARLYIPNYIATSRDLFLFLKSKFVFIPDPKNVELLQNFESFVYDNYHGVPFGGDCDCITIAAAASLIAMNKKYKIILAGNEKNPTHIFLEVNQVPFDVTRSTFGELPKYKKYWAIE